MGHALVAISLPGTDPVQKISIFPRGIPALGYTMQAPTEDRFLINKSELLNRIATLLGGRTAEEIVFEDISTRAHNDLARATDIARSMVKEYGMSAKVGQVYFARGKGAQFLNVPMEGAAEYSEATAELIDSEVKDIVNQHYARALEILQQRRDVLNKGAQLLLQKEKIEGTELQALIGETSSPPVGSPKKRLNMSAQKQKRRLLTDNELKTIKKDLIERKRKLWDGIDDDIDEDVGEEHQELIQMAKDGGDIGFTELRESTIFSLIKLKAKEIEKIEDALQRIEAGKYGRCSDCSRWIRPARLQFQPFAVRCRAGQEKR